MRNTKKLSIILALMLLAALVSSCGKSAEVVKDMAEEAVNAIEGFKPGEWEGNVYTNEKFALTVTVPEEWYISSQDEMETLFGDISELLKDSDVELDEGTLVPLLVIADNENSELVMSNMNVTAIRTILAPDFEEEYTDETLGEMAATMEQYGSVEISKVSEADFGGTKAHLVIMNTSITGTEYVQYQKIYQVFKSGYVLTFTISSIDEAAMDEIINTVSFE